MISLEKLWILTPLQKLPQNVGDWGKIIAAKGFKKKSQIFRQLLLHSCHLDIPKLVQSGRSHCWQKRERELHVYIDWAIEIEVYTQREKDQKISR